jgi:hypothetical protein
MTIKERAIQIKNATVRKSNTALRVGGLLEDMAIDNIIYIEKLADLPTPSSSVITLQANKTYIIAGNIDLVGNRLVAGGVCNIVGLSSETSFLTSTGLANGVPLITSQYTLVLEKLSFRDVHTCVSIDGNARVVALDWKGVNFINVTNVGVINNSENFTYNDGAFLGSQGLRFTGEIGTIALNTCLLRGSGSAGNIIELDASCTITRRFRIIYSSIIASSSTVGVNVNASATIPTEGYILDTVNFSGGSTYISGVQTSDNKALFINCVGITNTAVNGQMFMVDNVTATTIDDTINFFKVAGTTTASADNEKYNHSNNRLTNKAVIERKYLVSATLSFTSGATNVCEFGFFDSKLNAIRTPSRTKATANTAGRAENLTLQCVVNHSDNDYIEVHARNTSGANNITVSDLNVVITEIK